MPNTILFVGSGVKRYFASTALTVKQKKPKGIPPFLRPRSPQLQKFAIPAYYQFSPEDAEIFQSSRFSFRWRSSVVDQMISSTFDRHSTPLGPSPWDRPTHRLSTVLWPNAMLESYRKRPIYRPHMTHRSARKRKDRDVDGGRSNDVISRNDSRPDKQDLDKIAKSNMERLDSLWTLSTSHGLSWGRVDEVYMLFMDRYNLCLRQFANAEPELRNEAAKIAHQVVVRSREKELQSLGVDLSSIPDQSPVRCPRSRFVQVANM